MDLAAQVSKVMLVLTRPSSRSRAPSDDGEERAKVRKDPKGDRSTSARDSPNDPRNAEQLLDEELRSII